MGEVQHGEGDANADGDMTVHKEIIGGAELWLGDCREVLPVLRTADAVVTDPPYGLSVDYEGFDDSQANVAELAAEWLPLAQSCAPIVAFTPGKLNEWLYPRPSAVLAWCSPGGQGATSWGFPCHWPILVYGKDPYLSAGLGRRPDAFFPRGLEVDNNGHPCPKPLSVMKWIVWRVTPAPTATIVDPFMGSGTTGVACAQMGRKFVGVEIERKYFDIACRRIDDAQRQGDLLHSAAGAPRQERLMI